MTPGGSNAAPVIVVDASVVVKWVLNEPGSAWARALPASGATLAAPDLLCTECGNALWRMARTSRIDATALDRLWSAIVAAPLALRDCDWGLNAAALRLAARLDHPIYDCLYLALALERGAALATADGRFLRTLRRAAVLPPDRLLVPPDTDS